MIDCHTYLLHRIAFLDCHCVVLKRSGNRRSLRTERPVLEYFLPMLVCLGDGIMLFINVDPQCDVDICSRALQLGESLQPRCRRHHRYRRQPFLGRNFQHHKGSTMYLRALADPRVLPCCCKHYIVRKWLCDRVAFW